MRYIDAALFIEDWTAIMMHLADASFSAAAPQIADGAGIVHVRFTADEAEAWRGTPGVEVLAETPYESGIEDAADAAARLEAMIRADAGALAKWTSVRSLEPVEDPETGAEHTPPFWPAIVG